MSEAHSVNEKNTSQIGLETFGAGILIVGYLVITFAIKALAVSVLWGWFLVPFGLPVIGKLHALGICMLYSAVHIRPYPTFPQGKNQVAEIIAPILAPLWCIGVGWIVLQLM